VRTFIAVELSSEVRRRLAAAQERLRRAPCAVKWVKPALMHITLKFLGEIAETAVPEIEAVLASAAREAGGPFDLAVTGLGAFPQRGALRVLWAGVRDEGQLLRVHRRLDEGLAALGIARDHRPYSPHLTIGRVRGPRGAGALRELLARDAATEFGSCTIHEVVLVQSVLAPTGPLYTPLRREKL